MSDNQPAIAQIHSHILNSLNDGIVAMNHHGEILFANTAMVALFDYPADKLIGKNISYLLPELEQQSLDSFQLLGVNFQSTAMHFDGHAVPVELTINPMETREQTLYTAIIHDNSAQKAVDQLKHKFTSVINHELRTPLTAIRGSLGIVRSAFSEDFPDKAKQMLDIARNNTERLLKVIEDILHIENNDMDNLSYYFETFPIDEFIKESMTQNTLYAEQKSITLILHNQMADCQVFADRGRLLQVMYNLINSAIDSVDAGEVTVIISQHFNQLRISVTCGDALDLNDGVLDSISNTADDMTEVNLGISQAIIHKHQAELKFSNKENEVNAFYFELPVQP